MAGQRRDRAGRDPQRSVSKVYTANPKIQGGRAALRAADEAVPLARAAGRPQLAGNASAAYNAAGDALPASRQSVSLSQTLYDGGSTRAATEQAENAARAEQARLMLLEQQVLLDAIVAFTTVARDTQDLRARPGQRGTAAGRGRRHARPRAVRRLDQDRHLQAETRHAGAAWRTGSRPKGSSPSCPPTIVRIVGEPPDEPLMPPVPPGLPASLDEALAQADADWQLAGGRRSSWRRRNEQVAAAWPR